MERVEINTATDVAPEGHEEKMVAIANGETPVETSDTPARPEWLPEQFNTPEEMAKAYSELAAKQAQKAEEKPEDKPADNKLEIPEDPQKALADKGLKYEDFAAELAKTGTLSQESYDKLAAVGFDKAMVDSYIAGQNALAANFEAEVKAEVGGAERYADMVEWAKANLTPAEIDAYNKAVSAGSPEQAKLAVLGLSAKFTKAVGNEPSLLQGRNVTASEDVFQSYAQLTEAMRDPRYRKDPAYRAKVQDKLARSNL